MVDKEELANSDSQEAYNQDVVVNDDGDKSLENKPVRLHGYIKTNIHGFDDLLGKGIPKGSQVLVSGGPGTMKTTFCMHLLTNLAKQDMKALYITFEEPVENLLRNFEDYKWNLKELIDSDKLKVINSDIFQISRSVETLLAQARGELLIEVNEAKNLLPSNLTPDIVIIDSLSAISSGFFGKEEGYRAYIGQIFDYFRKMKITAFLITEIEHSTTRYSKSGVEEFLSDGVFAFYNIRQGNQRLNAAEIIKLRGSKHKKKIVPFKAIEGVGITVYPMEEIFLSEKSE